MLGAVHPGPDDRVRRPPALVAPGKRLTDAPRAVAGQVARALDPPHEVRLPDALVREAVVALHVLGVPPAGLSQRVPRAERADAVLVPLLVARTEDGVAGGRAGGAGGGVVGAPPGRARRRRSHHL